MGKGLLAAIKLALILAIVALAVVGSLYVLEVFATEEARLALKKILSILGIWTGASLVVYIIAAIGSQKGGPSQ
ncbi:MAG: hypothetical protein ACYTFE_05930 [Planctomycetota bacterium]|jgi:uncharacterized PurR-regulated membrane protein YhhQ (DUF165 family)